jgi:tetratricopeptide (TPR) repeat protein
MSKPTHRHFLTLALLVWLGTATSWAAHPQTNVYQEAVQQIIADLERGHVDTFIQAIDTDTIVDKATDGLLIEPQWKLAFSSSLTRGIEDELGPRLLSQMVPGSYIKLIRLKPNRAGAQALLRFDYGDMGNGYMDLHLVRSAEGDVRIVDWFDYAMGQHYSSSLKQLAGIMAPTPTFLGKLFDITSNRKETADTLHEIIALNKQQKHKELAHKFMQLDETYRRSRLLNLIAVQSANKSGDMKIYRWVLANLERFHGDDEKLFFILLDYYFLEQKYDKIFHGLDKLQIRFGVEEASLEAFRANACYQKGDYHCALSAASRAISLEPEYEYSYWPLLMSQIELGQYEKGVETARMLEKQFGYFMDPTSLSQLEGSDKFIQSKAYQQWRGEVGQ